MSEIYTFADVIIDPNDERVKVGDKYFFHINPTLAVESANSSNAESLELVNVVNNKFPFVYNFKDYMEGASCCIIRDKEEKKKESQGEKYQFGYLPKDLLPLVTYSKNNNVVMVDPNKLKIELLLRPIEKIR